MTDKICISCIVSGRVQGVWFRASAREKAQQLGLTGWVRNLPGGEVEVLACGLRERVEVFYQWLQVGPRLAKVVGVSYAEVAWEEWVGFEVRS
jgi:acylphosphatase